MHLNVRHLSSAWGLFLHRANGTKKHMRIDCVSGNSYNDRNHGMVSVICNNYIIEPMLRLSHTGESRYPATLVFSISICNSLILCNKKAKSLDSGSSPE
jgi:hypothetical protein